jgi:hypothetical protein
VVRLRLLFLKFGLCFVYDRVAGSVLDIPEIAFRPALRLNQHLLHYMQHELVFLLSLCFFAEWEKTGVCSL